MRIDLQVIDRRFQDKIGVVLPRRSNRKISQHLTVVLNLHHFGQVLRVLTQDAECKIEFRAPYVEIGADVCTASFNWDFVGIAGGVSRRDC